MVGPRIPNETRTCSFCKQPLHYGMCDELIAERERLAKELKPLPNPIVRPG